jgi:hypothetical protein
MANGNLAPSAPALQSIAASNTGLVLQKGDNDKKHIAGGKRGATGEPVRELQEALAAVGVFKFTPDGDFAGKTHDAVRRFQWYLNNMSHRLQVPPATDPSLGTVVPFSAASGIKVDGRATVAVIDALLAWVSGGFVTTSPLVKLDLLFLLNTDVSAEFTTLSYPSARQAEVLVHEDFVDTMTLLDGEAKAAKVKLRINQTFRVQNVPVKGAVVPPASKSQHLIGHAVDLNIVDGPTVNVSAMFKTGKETAAAKDFVKAVKKKGIRWGGDFAPKDPPHFDDAVPAGSDAYSMAFYFAQNVYAARHPLREA